MNAPLSLRTFKKLHQKAPLVRATATKTPGTVVRHEVKYLVPEARAESLKTDLEHFLIPDEHASSDRRHRYTVRSLYFDTPNIRFYYDKLDGNNCRLKFRIRRYEVAAQQPSDWFFEIKSKYHNACVKPGRIGFSDSLLRRHLLEHGSIRLSNLVEEISSTGIVNQQATIWALPLEPKLLVVYDREALVDARRRRFRVTFDTNVRALFTGNPHWPIGAADSVELATVMEVKFEQNIPFWLEALIRKHGLLPEATSKYGHGVEAALPFAGGTRCRSFADEGISSAVLSSVKEALFFVGKP